MGRIPSRRVEVESAVEHRRVSAALQRTTERAGRTSGQVADGRYLEGTRPREVIGNGSRIREEANKALKEQVLGKMRERTAKSCVTQHSGGPNKMRMICTHKSNS